MNSVYIKGNKAAREHCALLHIFGKGFTEDQLAKAAGLKYESTTFYDAYDETRHTLLDEKGEEIAKIVIPGY